ACADPADISVRAGRAGVQDERRYSSAALVRRESVQAERALPPKGLAVDVPGSLAPGRLEDLRPVFPNLGGLDLAERSAGCTSRRQRRPTHARIELIQSGESGRRVPESTVDTPFGGEENGRGVSPVAGEVQGFGQHPAKQAAPAVRPGDRHHGE